MPLKSCNVAAGLIFSRSSVWLKHPRAPSTFRHGIFERFVFFVDFSMMQLSVVLARLLLWLPLARSDKHYGKHTAEDLYLFVYSCEQQNHFLKLSLVQPLPSPSCFNGHA